MTSNPFARPPSRFRWMPDPEDPETMLEVFETMTDLPDSARCETCRFASSKGTGRTAGGELVRFFLCRIRSVEEFPTRRDEDWCGEWRPKAEAD